MYGNRSMVLDEGASFAKMSENKVRALTSSSLPITRWIRLGRRPPGQKLAATQTWASGAPTFRQSGVRTFARPH